MPDIFNITHERDSFRMRLLLHAFGACSRADQDRILEIARGHDQDKKFEISLTMNGVELPAFSVFEWLEGGFTQCVNEAAEQLIKDRLQDRLSQVTNIIDEFQRALTEAVNPPRAG
jgi:hypothetical protein